jgi:hypothetical protein
MAQPQLMNVMVPQGMMGGGMIQVSTPNGQMMQVQIPYGCVPGMTFQVQLPAPQPQMVGVDVNGDGVVDLRAVQSSPFPPCAARRRGGPGGGLGTPGLAPGPRPPRPHLRKKLVPRREADSAAQLQSFNVRDAANERCAFSELGYWTLSHRTAFSELG